MQVLGDRSSLSGGQWRPDWALFPRVAGRGRGRLGHPRMCYISTSGVRSGRSLPRSAGVRGLHIVTTVGHLLSISIFVFFNWWFNFEVLSK